MSLDEAIHNAESRSRNINLHWFVCKWNDGYIIHSSTYMKKFPTTKYVYSTGSFKNSWDIVYSTKDKVFKHRATIKE